VLGGICLDAPVGGLNPAAVETALNSGARIVWLPTISAADNSPFLDRMGGIGLRTIDTEWPNAARASSSRRTAVWGFRLSTSG
jgi:hypothetical protein